MIKTFKCKETKKKFEGFVSKKLPYSLHRVALRKLYMLHAATQINDLRIPPANRLEILKGSRKGQHSIRINLQWRICFFWQSGNVYNIRPVPK